MSTSTNQKTGFTKDTINITIIKNSSYVYGVCKKEFITVYAGN